MEGTLGVVMFVYLAGTPAMGRDFVEVSGEALRCSLPAMAFLLQ